MRHLGISGGGTKIAGLFGVAESIIYERGYIPEVISGISAGAILALPLALGKREEIKTQVLNITLDDFFEDAPIKANGKINIFNAIRKIIGGKHYLGDQKNLEKTLAKTVSRTEFEAYKLDASKAICIVGSVDFYTGKRFYINIKTVSYENFLKFVNASASIPVFTPGIAMDSPVYDFEGKTVDFPKLLLFDGGVRDHSPTNKILSSTLSGFQISETTSIFSRPDDIRDILSPKNFAPKNFLRILERYTEISNAEISKNDETEEKNTIARKGIIDHGTFYLPRIMQGVYDVDKQRLNELYEASKKLVNDDTWLNTNAIA
ncbi:MAG: patatin-like phospholipase family protein [Pricia sp.]|nr:patatin-like phospholipase family protein [Pricia sp.]